MSRRTQSQAALRLEGIVSLNVSKGLSCTISTEQNMVYCAVGLQMTAKSTITTLHQETALGSTRVMRGSCMSSHTQPNLRASLCLALYDCILQQHLCRRKLYATEKAKFAARKAPQNKEVGPQTKSQPQPQAQTVKTKPGVTTLSLAYMLCITFFPFDLVMFSPCIC